MEATHQKSSKTAKQVRHYMRLLHNYIGFFIAGLVIIYSLSGILQTYRDTDLLKHDVPNKKELAANLDAAQLKEELKMKTLTIEKTEGNVLYFTGGTYNQKTGVANYTTKEWYGWLKRITGLHKTASKSAAHYFTTIFGVLLLFMSISAFWMFKPGTRLFSRGVYITVAGLVAAVVLLLI